MKSSKIKGFNVNREKYSSLKISLKTFKFVCYYLFLLILNSKSTQKELGNIQEIWVSFGLSFLCFHGFIGYKLCDDVL